MAFGWRWLRPRRVGPLGLLGMTKDQDCHCEERSDAAIRIPVPKAPLCKGSCHGFAVTEGLPGVAGYFGDDLCSDSYPFLAPTGASAPLCDDCPGWLMNPP